MNYFLRHINKNKTLTCFLVPVVFFFIIDLVNQIIGLLYIKYFHSTLISFLNSYFNHNTLLIIPINSFFHGIVLPLIGIIFIIVILWKMGFNFKIIKKIEFKKIIIFIILICVFYILCFYVFIKIRAIPNSFFRITNQFITREEKVVNWTGFIYFILNYIFYGIQEELLFRVFCIFIFFKFSNSIIWSILFSGILFDLSHFYYIKFSFPFFFINYEILDYYYHIKFLGAIIYSLLLILSDNLIIAIFCHFFANIFFDIIINKFQSIIQCTVQITRENYYTWGIQSHIFFFIMTKVVFIIILLIIFFKKKKYYLERYEANWLMPVSK